MKENELRIGNWVDIKDLTHAPKTWQIEGVGNLIQVGHQLWSIEEIEPIPLTEEWLERFGFEWMDEIAGYADGDHCVFISHGGDCWFHIFCTNDNDCHVKIKYVHSLQNLYFCLTGKELDHEANRQV